MKKNLLTILTTILAMLTSADETASVTFYIVGGQPVTENGYPWQVSLQKDGQHFCGGSLIASRWVLTAAHCLEGISQDDIASKHFNIRVGTRDLSRKSTGLHARADARFFHTTSQGRADIALVRLKQPVNNIPYLALADEVIMRTSGYQGTMATISGWGATSEDSKITPSLLRQVNVPIVSWNLCNFAYSGELSRHDICAGYLHGGKDACFGDSGGSLVVQHQGRPVQVGIVSRGRGCGSSSYYGIYTRVASFYPWINDTIANHNP